MNELEVELKVKAFELSIEFTKGYGNESDMIRLAKKIYNLLASENEYNNTKVSVVAEDINTK